MTSPEPTAAVADLVAGAGADPAQRAVVAAPTASSGVVVGAPGSGKTETLVARVVELVRRGVDPDDIVVLTPSRQTATALRDRLAIAVGRATSGPLARSLASFAFGIVRSCAVAAGAEPPQLLTGGDEDQIIHDMLDGDAEDEAAGQAPGRWPAWLGAGIRDTRGFRSEVRAFLAECETLGLDPVALRELGRAHEVPEWEAMASFQREYTRVRAGMRGAHRDAAGLLREAVGLLRAGAPGLDVVDRVRHVLVDDAQELTAGAVDLLEACRDRGAVVLAFGDPDVGSGAFRGATPANFARVAAALGTTWVLSTMHRGTAAATDVIRRVTQRIGAAGVVAHRSAPVGVDADASVRALTVRSPAEEFDVIARLLRERHVHDGIAWDRLAVIAHDSRQITALHAELAARDVPVVAPGSAQALGEIAPVRDLLRLIELAADDDWSVDDVTDALLGVTGRLDPIELRRLRSSLRHAELAAGGDRSGRDLLLAAMRTPVVLDLIDAREARRAAATARTLAHLRAELDRGASAHELLWSAWEQSGLQKPWALAAAGHGPVADQAGRDLDAIVALFQAAKRFGERSVDADPRVFVRSVLDAAVAEDRLDPPPSGKVVRLLTPAASLGLEFDTVVVAGVQDGLWPNTRLRGGLLHTWRLADALSRDDAASPSTLDRRRAAMHDELRLLVRALSRATSRCVVTAVDDDDTGPSVFFEFLPPAEAVVVDHPLSLRGLVATHRRTLTTPGALLDAAAASRARAHAAAQLALLADARVPGADPSHWYGVAAPTSTGPLRDLQREHVRVSPSRLHTLEECALNWVIGDLGGDPGGVTAGLGTILHAALENAEEISEEALWRTVEARWGELVFEAGWRERAEKTRARDLVRRLHAYLRRFDAEGGRLIGAEPHFEVALPVVGAEDAPHGVVVSGYIDRVELTPDGKVVIVDLKTGKREPQTDEKVADNPQLAAYQLAFESGAIAAAEGHPPGGAQLLVLRPTSKADFVTPRQAPFDDERREAFLTRIQEAVAVMRSTSFAAPFEEHCRDEHAYGLCRIHTIGAVSAS
ncbi:ATP-dependent helicase [Microbacterium xanthum]|uniref:ATP-dependent helicase n=1 Tax=Microbacterium xanthum TaxID=3079794 RepID=UPI002AD28548|nr:ATP-dependent DNA helicase [Microbacterium sp. KSW-48]MDZ8172161.1 ATP-dependent DNA helicase [Microbacterium sp. KSW-48]